MKAFDKLEIPDFEKHPVWQIVEDDKYSSLMLNPVKKLPVEHLENRIVGTKVALADGTITWAILSNISATEKLRNTHFLNASINCNGSWFDLARYHDSDFERRNGDVLAKKLGKSIEQVFPIVFDVSSIVSGEKSVLKDEINYLVRDQLTMSELISMAVNG
jgi:hypothetical protein